MGMGRGRRLKGAASGRFLTVCMHPVRALLPQDFSMGKRSGCLPPHTIHPVQCDQLCYLESAPSQKARDKEKVRRIAGNASDEEGNKIAVKNRGIKGDNRIGQGSIERL